MKILIVGGGGREHAIATVVAKSKKVSKIYCAPGNAGIGQIAECVNIGAMEFDKIVAFAKEKEIDLTIVGMDDPLVLQNDGFIFVKEHSMTSEKYINELKGTEKFIFKNMFAGSFAKRLYRLFECQKCKVGVEKY